VFDYQNVTHQWQRTRVNKLILHILLRTTWIDHSPWSANVFDEPYQCNYIVTKFKVILSNNLKKICKENRGYFRKWHRLFFVKRGWIPTSTRTQNREKHYFGLKKNKYKVPFEKDYIGITSAARYKRNIVQYLYGNWKQIIIYVFFFFFFCIKKFRFIKLHVSPPSSAKLAISNNYHVFHISSKCYKLELLQ
jgi:hypothetical protein